MNKESERLEKIGHLLKSAANGGADDKALLEALLTLHIYGQEEHSQFGMGLSGWVMRQSRGETLLTVKVTESGVPLVAYITSYSPTGSIEKYLDMLEDSRVKWSKDRYPWI